MGLGPITVGIIADMSKFASEAQKGFTDALPKLDLSAKHLGRMAGEAITTGVKVGLVALGATITASIAGAAYAFASFSKEGIGLADALSDSAQGLGVSSSALLLFREAAVQAGADVSALENAMAKFNIKLGDAKLGSDEAIKAFSQIGVSIQQLQALSPEAAFQLVANALGRVQDSSIRASYAMDIFGKSGAPIAKAMGAIGEKTQELESYWKSLGATITSEEINSTGAIADRMDLIHDGLSRFKVLLAAQVAPLLAASVSFLEDAVKEVGGLEAASKKFFTTFVDVAAMIAAVAQTFYGIGLLIESAIKLAGAFGARMTWAAAQIAGGMEIAFGKAMQWVNEFLAELAGGMSDLVDGIGGFFSNMLGQIGMKMVGMLNTIVDSWNWWVGKTGLGTTATYFTYTAVDSAGYQPNRHIETDIEASLRLTAKQFEEMAVGGIDLIEASQRAMDENTMWEESGQALNDAVDAFSAVFANGPGSWSSQVRDIVGKLTSDAKKDSGKKTNQQLIDERNAWQNNIGSGVAASPRAGVNLPGSVSNNLNSGYGSDTPNVVFNQTYQNGITAHQVKKTVQESLPMITAAVQKKVAAGGNYRREIQG